MLRILLVMALAASFVPCVSAQEQPADAAAGPTITEAVPGSHEYEIELKILEGKGLIADDRHEAESLIAAPRHGDLPPEIAKRKPTPLAVPTPATLAQPQYLPTQDVDRASKVQNGSVTAPPPAPDEASDAEFIRHMYFDLLLREPTVSEARAFLEDQDPQKRHKLVELLKSSIGRELRGATVLATPKVTAVAKRPATVRIGTEQVFSYLEPLGNGKFQVKPSPAYELGLTFTLEVQPMAGGDRFVELSQFEVQVSGLDGRKPVDGIEDLDVGRPIVSERSLQTTAKIRLGDTSVIAIPSGPKTQAVVLVRINQLNPRVIGWTGEVISVPDGGTVLLGGIEHKEPEAGAVTIKIKNVIVDHVNEADRTISLSFGKEKRRMQMLNVPLAKNARVVVSHVLPGSVNHVPFNWEYVKRLQGRLVSVCLAQEGDGLLVVSIASGND